MARPLSPEKRSALLQSAKLTIAEQGVLASTASIARRAGVAEGTLFTYFENKETLFQELYLHLKAELAETMMPGYPDQATCRQQLEHIFQQYVSWGLADMPGRLAIERLAASGLLLEATRQGGMEPFMPVSQMMEEAVRSGVLVNAPIAFLYAIIEQIADITIDYVSKDPEDAEQHRERGFQASWRAVAA